MTGFSAPCKKERPLAAPIAIFNLVAQGSDVSPTIICNGLLIYVICLIKYIKKNLKKKDYDTYF
jgi:hypothetical protein